MKANEFESSQSIEAQHIKNPKSSLHSSKTLSTSAKSVTIKSTSDDSKTISTSALVSKNYDNENPIIMQNDISTTKKSYFSETDFDTDFSSSDDYNLQSKCTCKIIKRFKILTLIIHLLLFL